LHVANADASWLAGFGVGTSKNQDYDCIGCGPIGAIDDSGRGYKLFGGNRFHRNIAVVGGFAQLADTEATGPLPFTDQLEVNGAYVSAVGILPLSATFELFSTLGLFRWNQDVTYNGIGGSFNGTDLTYSVGAGYNFSVRGAPGIALQAEWQHFRDVGTSDALLGHIDDYSLATVNFVFRFQ
ncbi:MAG: outer membrane beta-barrel protein, partial [Candidatus Obscuribacterales bacterium]|nr:outer membrane beta-barrel protein [Steroidobacteraceae bacterium]